MLMKKYYSLFWCITLEAALWICAAEFQVLLPCLLCNFHLLQILYSYSVGFLYIFGGLMMSGNFLPAFTFFSQVSLYTLHLTCGIDFYHSNSLNCLLHPKNGVNLWFHLTISNVILPISSGRTHTVEQLQWVNKPSYKEIIVFTHPFYSRKAIFGI